MKFAPGHSGNPTGRPPGSRNRAGLAARLDRLVTAAATDIVEGLVERARAGDALAADVLLQRAWPARSDAR
jgi:hypothetical protein